MKIKKNKDISLSEESKNALKNYKLNQIKTNMKLHIIFLFLIIIINIGLIFFIFFFKSKISTISKLSKKHTSDIDIEDNQLLTQRTSLDKKMVNIASIGSFNGFRFSFIFEKSEDFQKMKKIIYDYRMEISDKIPSIENIQNSFYYQGNTDSDDYFSFFHALDYSDDIAIIIQTIEGKKFGVYHKGLIKPDKNFKFDSECKDVFLFTLNDDNRIYKFKGKKYSMHLNKNISFSLGDDELVIYKNYFSNGGYINFPLKSFDFSTVNNNVLTENNGKFQIRNIEIFHFIFNLI